MLKGVISIMNYSFIKLDLNFILKASLINIFTLTVGETTTCNVKEVGL